MGEYSEGKATRNRALAVYKSGAVRSVNIYQSMLRSFISYATVLVRPDDLGTDRGSLCFWACSSVLLVHPKGGRPGGTRVVTS